MSQFTDDRTSVETPRTYASLAAAGLSRHGRPGRDWRRVSRGLYVPTATTTTTAQRITEAAAVMGSRGVIAGWAAAYVHGVDQLDGRDDFSYASLPVPVLMPVDVHRKSTAAIDYRQDELSVTDLVEVERIRITTALRTALDLSCWARNRVEALVVLDAMLNSGLVTSVDLEQKLPTMVGQSGSRRAAEAVEQARTGVMSTWESRLRAFCIWELGWPAPLVNPTVTDCAGYLLGIPDLLDEEAGLVLEYDGSRWKGSEIQGGHRNPEQHRTDNVREECFERSGLTVVRVAKADLGRHRDQLRLRLLSARKQGLGRDRQQDRWKVSTTPRHP